MCSNGLPWDVWICKIVSIRSDGRNFFTECSTRVWSLLTKFDLLLTSRLHKNKCLFPRETGRRDVTTLSADGANPTEGLKGLNAGGHVTCRERTSGSSSQDLISAGECGATYRFGSVLDDVTAVEKVHPNCHRGVAQLVGVCFSQRGQLTAPPSVKISPPPLLPPPPVPFDG